MINQQRLHFARILSFSLVIFISLLLVSVQHPVAAASVNQCVGAPFVWPTYGNRGWLWKRDVPTYSSPDGIHDGIDIRSVTNNPSDLIPIYAVYDGWLTSETYKLYLEVNIDSSYAVPNHHVFVYYTHMGFNATGRSTLRSDLRNIAEGSRVWVKKGEFLGYQGNIGAEIIHLHLSVNAAKGENQNNIDPTLYFGDVDLNDKTTTKGEDSSQVPSFICRDGITQYRTQDIGGVVRDANNVPVSYPVYISLFTGNKDYFTWSTGTGVYYFRDIPEGIITLKAADHLGNSVVLYGVNLSSTSASVDLRLNNTCTSASVQLLQLQRGVVSSIQSNDCTPLQYPQSPTTTTTTCPSGQNGWYCGGTSLVGGAAGTLYRCDNGVYTVANVCANGCIQEPQGTADHCATTSVDYCKTVTWGGAGQYCNGDKLVTCSSFKTTTATVQCQFGCQQNPLFTPDSCRTSDAGNSYNNATVKFYGDSGENPATNSLRLEVGVGTSNAPSNGAVYKSFQLPAGWSMKTFTQDNSQGDQRCWSKSEPLVESEGWHNKIESVEVFTTNVCTTDAPELPSWSAHYYPGDSKWWDPDIAQSSAACSDKVLGETLSKNFGASSPCGGNFSTDNWVGEFTATRYFPEGDYIFRVKSDDGAQLFVNGRDRWIRASAGDAYHCPAFHLSGNVDLKVMLREDGGDANIEVIWDTDVSSCLDVTPPVGSMTAPAVNTFNNGIDPIALAATAADLQAAAQATLQAREAEIGSAQADVSGVARVDFYARSNNWNNNDWTLIGSDADSPYQFEMPTTDKPEGLYFFSAKAVDAQGNVSEFPDQEFWTNATIDRTKPTSMVLPVPTATGFQFNISWIGRDNLTLDSLLNYDVQYSPNCDGTWSDWIGFRAGTTATFTGRPGEAYCFRSRSIDLSGNVADWSVASATVSLPTCAENELVAEYYDDANLTGNLLYVQCENSINHDWGAGAPAIPNFDQLYGDGGDGPFIVNGQVTSNPIDAVASGAAGSYTLNATNANFRTGHKILIYQVKGANAGIYQITSIDNYANGIITTHNPLKTDYASGGANAAQVIVIPQYSDFTVNAGSRLVAKDWNGQTGGVLIFMANGTINIQGVIDAGGAGFRGGRSGANPNPSAFNTNGEQGENYTGIQLRSRSQMGPGGGGGGLIAPNAEGSGGGGGGHATAGQTGGYHSSTTVAPGDGGTVIGDPSLEKMYFGGGGGGGGFGDAQTALVNNYGNGGDGGGIIYVIGKRIQIAQSSAAILAQGLTGQPGINDVGAGGNGAGGTVKYVGGMVDIAFSTSAPGNGSLPGGTSGNGGRGGAGRVKVEYVDSFSGQASPQPFVEQITSPADDFSVRWTGNLVVTPGEYKLRTRQDDGLRIWVNGAQMINDWVDGETQNLEYANLASVNSFRAEFYEHQGNAYVHLDIIPGANLPPTASPIPSQVVEVDQEFPALNLGMYISDPDFDALTWQNYDGTDIDIQIDPSGLAHITKTPGWIGIETADLTVTDEWGQPLSFEIIFQVIPIQNHPPFFNPIPHQSIDEDTSFNQFKLSDYAHDPDGDVLTYTFTGNTDLIVSIDPDSLVTVQAPTNYHGTERFTFTTTDTGGLSATVEVIFTVNSVNDLPVITSMPLLTGQLAQLYGYQMVATDADNDVLTYSVVTGPTAMSISSAGVVNWAVDQSGDIQVVLAVSDGTALVQQAFTVHIDRPNNPPAITQIPSQTIDEDGQFAPIRIDDYASDPDGDQTTISVSGNTNLVVQYNASTRVFSIVAPANYHGSETLRFRISDGQVSGNEVSAVFTVNSINDLPVITSQPPLLARLDEQYCYQVLVRDADGDALSYTLSAAPAGMTITTSGLLCWTPSGIRFNSTLVTIVVSDGQASATQSYKLGIDIPNHAPVITSSPTVLTVRAGVRYSYDVNASDPDSNMISYTLVQGPAGMSVNFSTGMLLWTPTAAQVGDYTIIVQAADWQFQTKQEFILHVVP